MIHRYDISVAISRLRVRFYFRILTLTFLLQNSKQESCTKRTVKIDQILCKIVKDFSAFISDKLTIAHAYERSLESNLTFAESFFFFCLFFVGTIISWRYTL